MGGFPKAIKSPTFRYTVDETGFSESEKVALTNAWSFISNDKKKHATEILYRFLVDNAKYLKKFKISEERFNNESLHAHPHWVLQSYTSLIEDGVKDLAKLNQLLLNLVKAHKKVGLDGEDMSTMTTIANDYFKEVLAKRMTPTLETALDKVKTKFIQGYDTGEVEN